MLCEYSLAAIAIAEMLVIYTLLRPEGS